MVQEVGWLQWDQEDMQWGNFTARLLFVDTKTMNESKREDGT